MKRVNLVATLLAVAGLGVSLYLWTVHLGWWSAVCLGIGDCEKVNISPWSTLPPTSPGSTMPSVPVALLGALAYLAIIALGLFLLRDPDHEYSAYARLARFFIALVGVAFSGYLTYAELFWIHDICPWCVTSAVIITLIAILSILDYRQPVEMEPA